MALMFRSVLQSGGGAELVVTCDSEFAGATISCSDGTSTLNKTCPVSSPYEVTFKIPNSGDWTVSATVSGTTYSSDPISVDLDYETDLEFGFNWKRWVDTAQYLDSTDYSTLSDLLADEEAVRELFLEHACVDYMAEATSSNADLETIIENDLCAKWINNSDYALDFLGANTAIKALMDEADKYGYGEWVITDDSTTPPTWGPKGNVPVMTANNAPYGEASASGQYSSDYAPYKAFNGVNSSTTDCWISAQNSIANAYLSYTSPNPICVKAIKLENRNATTVGAIKNFKLQGSNDGTTWTDIATLQNPNNAQSQSVVLSVANNDNYYLKHRILVVDAHTEHSSDYVAVGELQFYGRELKVSVPTMTSDTSPFGEAIAVSEGVFNGVIYGAYRAFNRQSGTGNWWHSGQSEYGGTDTWPKWVGYKFEHPICVRGVMIQNPNDSDMRGNCGNYTLQGSHTGNSNDWVNIETKTRTNNVSGGITYDDFSGNDFYEYFRINIAQPASGSDVFCRIMNLQFYGLDYSEKEFEVGTTKKWLYDHGLFLDSEVMSTANGWTAYNGTTVTTFTAPTVEDSEVYMASDTVCGIGCKQSINLSDYSYLFAKVAGKTISSSSYGQLGVYSAKDNSNSTRLGYISLTEAKPSQIGLDISAQNTNAYCEFFVANGRAAWLNEFWLE